VNAERPRLRHVRCAPIPDVPRMQKTRLLELPAGRSRARDDQPGDYRSSGCTGLPRRRTPTTARPDHAGKYAPSGKRRTHAKPFDPTMVDPARVEPGHPLKHTFTRSIPSEPVHLNVPQCTRARTNGHDLLRLHVVGETRPDGEKMYPAEVPGNDAARTRSRRSGAAIPSSRRDQGQVGRHEVSRPDHHARREFNKQLEHTAVPPISTATGGCLYAPSTSAIAARQPARTRTTRSVSCTTIPNGFGKAVHLKDIHLERGCSAADCHFGQDNHGNGKLYGENCATRSRSTAFDLPRL